MLLDCSVGEDSWESLGLQGDLTSPSSRKSVLNIHWKDWCWSWNSNTLATWYEELTHLKRPWFWEWLKAGGEGDDRGWDGWTASPTWWTWFWASSRSLWWTGSLACCSPWGLSQIRLSDWTDWLTDWLMLYCCSVAKLCLTPCDPVDHSMPGSPVLYYLTEFAQIPVHLLPPSSPFVFNLYELPLSTNSFPRLRLTLSYDLWQLLLHLSFWSFSLIEWISFPFQ